MVHAFVETEHVEVGLANALHEALAEHPEGARPALVELKQGRPLSAIQDATHDATTHDLAQLTPRQVFGMMCVRAGKSDAAQARLMEAFDQIRQADEVALASLIPASVGTRPEAEGGG